MAVQRCAMTHRLVITAPLVSTGGTHFEPNPKVDYKGNSNDNQTLHLKGRYRELCPIGPY